MNIKLCDNCIKRGTMDCPNSALCYSTEDKPFFIGKETYEKYSNEIMFKKLAKLWNNNINKERFKK